MSAPTPILRSPDIAREPFKLSGPRPARRLAKDSPAAPGSLAAAAGDAPAPHRSFDADAAEAMTVPAGFEEGREEGREHGYRAGYEAGLAAGREDGMREGDAEGREAYTAGLRQLEELTRSLNLSVGKSLDEAEDMMVSIVFESVCKIVGDALATREGVAAVVHEALGRTRGRSALVIRVNPLDLELIEEGAAFGVASEADWRADEAIPMGGCIVESEYGTLDARIDTQLNQLKRTLLATRHKPVDDTETD